MHFMLSCYLYSFIQAPFISAFLTVAATSRYCGFFMAPGDRYNNNKMPHCILDHEAGAGEAAQNKG